VWGGEQLSQEGGRTLSGEGAQALHTQHGVVGHVLRKGGAGGAGAAGGVGAMPLHHTLKHSTGLGVCVGAGRCCRGRVKTAVGAGLSEGSHISKAQHRPSRHSDNTAARYIATERSESWPHHYKSCQEAGKHAAPTVKGSRGWQQPLWMGGGWERVHG
jgi:hypothetical protein